MQGFIGFGKTTIAKRLALELPAVRLNNDQRVVELFGPGPHKRGELDDYDSRINEMHWDLAREIVRTGTDVIMDTGKWSKSGRREQAERALEFADKVIFHDVKCDIDIARARCVARTESENNEMFICANAFDVLLQKFEPMSDDEGFEVITYDNS